MDHALDAFNEGLYQRQEEAHHNRHDETDNQGDRCKDDHWPTNVLSSAKVGDSRLERLIPAEDRHKDDDAKQVDGKKAS